MTKATPFLMFQHGKAQAALDFWVATVPGTRIVELQLFGPEGPGPEGTVLRGHAEIAGQSVMIHDSFITHGFDFTPSWSFFLECGEEAEAERLFAALGEGGQVLMPLDNYGWSRKFGWVSDRFGISWQVNWQ
ncbi:VOC family protein [Sphingomonas sp. G-3-2-10]|uniref:VOC family protein n=1 Tax=Sphingomonas sp. G-3-2-10 TaxID=2728838 RepID=UPI00146CC446|nr:VOC family protein [Sphingomonas sp. G-3-2-10]NML07748.1 VOC family protein [Sphingomonas sp. G-3-2-10]